MTDPSQASEQCLVDGLVPGLTLAPHDAAELALLLKQASAEHRIVAPVGGGTMLELGSPLEKLDIALSLEKLNRVIDYAPANLTVQAEAGITLLELNDLLARRGQFLPLDPPLPHRATIGGILASNTSGPLRLAFGPPRDLVIGIRVALTSGDIVHGGGQVVKNVAGYDLPKLFTGSLGTLGVIVQATFKLAPLPVQDLTAWASFSSIPSAAAVLLRTIRSSLAPHSLVILSPAVAASVGLSGTVLLARFAGLASATLRSGREFLDWARDAGAVGFDRALSGGDLWPRLRDFPAMHSVTARLGVLPTEIAAAVARLESETAASSLECAWVAHATGSIYFSLDGPPAPLLQALLRIRTGIGPAGYLVLLRGPRELRLAFPPWGPPGSDFQVTRRLKEMFDAAHILNPGRFLGRI